MGSWYIHLSRSQESTFIRNAIIHVPFNDYNIDHINDHDVISDK